MARTQKKGLDYFPFDVDFFSDKKIKILKSRYGVDGITLYLYLLCEIYKNGYYIILDEDWEFVISDDLGMSNEKVKQVLRFLLERSMFDNTLFQSDNVITSTRIQKSFQGAVKARASKVNIEVIDKYWILTSEETASYIKVTHFKNNSEKNDNKSEKNDTKKSKVKKSKVNNNNVQNEFERAASKPTKKDIDEFFEKIWKLYPKKRGKGQVSDSKKKVLFNIGIEEITRAIERYTAEHTDNKYLQNGSTFFNSGYVDFLDENYSDLPSEKKKTSFEQRSYDYNDLEQRLLANRQAKMQKRKEQENGEVD